MKRLLILPLAAFLLAQPMLAWANGVSLARMFVNPPDEAKPWVFWWWLEGNVTNSGITQDLEEMKRQGINGVLIFSAGGAAGPMPSGDRFLSPAWHDHFRHTLREANRLKMQVSVNLCDGWDSGGSWIEPDDANKKVVSSEIQVEGGASVSRALPIPEVVDGYYRDVATIAFREKRSHPVVPAAVAASSSASGYCGEWNWPPRDATDFDPRTAWRSAEQPTAQRPAWLELRYHDPLPVTGMYVVPARENGPRECELQASADGKTFDPVCRMVLQKGQPARLSFPPHRARVFRFVMTSSYGSPVELAEVTLLRDGDEPLLRPGIQWWMFKSGNRSFWDWPRQGPEVLNEEYPDRDGWADCRGVVDLSARVRNGRLDWNAPAGRWTVLRFGYTLEGQRTRAACAGGPTGYEADMLSSRGIEKHFRNTAQPVLSDAKEVGGGALKYLHIDSYEVGADVQGQQPTWTQGFLEEFRKKRGYDMLPYLPALARRIVVSRDVTDRFLWDYRRTIADLFAEKFWKRFADLAHARGVGVHMETGYGTYPYPHIDGLQCAGVADIPMGEFWQGTDIMSQFDPWGDVIRTVSSAAHTYGRQLTQAESFTSWTHWLQSPATLKAVGDQAFCAGLNRMVFHQYTHQPELDMKPGWQYGAGTHFDRNVTWWEPGRAFFRYLSRCQSMLQQGRFVADVAYFYGEGSASFVPGKDFVNPPLPPGYDYDGMNAEVLLRRMSVRDGGLVLPDGMSYRLLVVPDSPMPPAILRKIRSLVIAGAAILGPRPQRSPGLPVVDGQVRRIAAQLWGRCDGRSITEVRYGKGRVFCGISVGEALSRLKAQPDFEFVATAPHRAGLAGARWIWHAADPDRSPPGERTFLATLRVPPGKIRYAEASLTADNGFELNVNGALVCRGSDFHTVVEADIAPFIHPGDNVVVVKATNGGMEPNPAGLIGRLVVQPEEGAPTVLATGPGWSSIADNGTPSAVRVMGGNGTGPWGSIPEGKIAGPVLNWIHRRTAEADIYFVVNRTDRWLRGVRCTFGSPARPEFWDPVSGEIRDAQTFEHRSWRTELPIDFAPNASTFVVFRKAPWASPHAHPAPNFTVPVPFQTIHGPWMVRFDPAWGGPAEAEFNELQDWTSRPEAGIRYYSGTATYRNSFDLTKTSGRIYLDLGTVHEIARVRLNGKDLGVVWTAPWSVEITRAARQGVNKLEIEVTNLWPNRIIGDAALPETERLTRTNVRFGTGDPLLPSGLFGPVRVMRS